MTLVGVWGAGAEGHSAARMLHARGDDVLLVDETAGDRPADLADGVRFAAGEGALEQLLECALVVCSPGVPGVHPFRARLAERDVGLTSLTAMWMEQHGATTIGVTGTKGKSTTTTLIGALVEAAGHEAQIGGNIGIPLAELRPGVAVTVAELSSYQCASLTVAPATAVVTSLYADHLTWHGSQRAYWRDKARIAGAGCETLICDEPTLHSLRSVDAVLPEHVVMPTAALAERVAGLGLSGALALRQNQHNLQLAILAVEDRLGRPVTDAEIFAAAGGFRALPHRLEVVAEREGVRWVDDTLSTVPESVVAALSAFDGEAVVIVGGEDRGLDHGVLTEYLLAREPLAHLVTIPSDGERIAERYRRMHPELVHDAGSLAEAVPLAARIAVPGGAVLLSPGAPSYDFFRNFAHKSEAFVRAIRALDG